MNDLDLHQRLAAPPLEQLGRPDLDAIHRLGTRRRRGRLAAYAGGTALALAAVGGVGLGVATQDPTSSRGPEVTVYSRPAAPETLDPLARRALDEVPGAVRVGPGQVVVPGPGGRPQHTPPLDPADLVRGPVGLDAHDYTGVTAYAAARFPAWLHAGVQEIEETELAEPDGSYPVGSTEMGLLVDAGESQLACLARRTSVGEDQPGDSCYPALLVSTADGPYLDHTLGSDSFLEPGAEMELFADEDYSTGAPRTLWVGGLDGTDVTRVVLDLEDGSQVEAEVDRGEVVPGDTMFWVSVRGDLTHVTAYDAEGTVVDDHEVTACSGGVDCEVR